MRRSLTLETLETRTVMSGSPLAADADQSLTTPTRWAWYQNVAPSVVSQKLSDLEGRLTDIEVEQVSPLRLTVTMVKNEGEYQKSWWWYHGLTATELKDKLELHSARIQDMEVYEVSGGRRFAAIIVPNTGEQQKNWWYYHGISASTLSQSVETNKARIIDLDTRVVNGTRVYDAVMVRNTGVDAKPWWYYHNRTASQITTLLSTNKARIIDIEERTNGSFDVVMVKNEDSWWWYRGLTQTELTDRVGRNGARIVDIERYQVNGQTRYAASLINNSNELTTKVGSVLRDATPTGHVGAFLKEVNGPVLANLQSDRKFEPASMIKVLSYLHTLMRMKANDPRAELSKRYSFYHKPGDNINNNTKGDPDVNPNSYAQTSSNRITESLGIILERMMERSDNRATKSVFEIFGEAEINATAAQIGMSNTQYTSTIGTGIPGNYLTLRDASKLYEGVLDGTLLGTGTAQSEFFRRMIDGDSVDEEDWDNSADSIPQYQRDLVYAEVARKLDLPADNSAVVSMANSFISRMRRGAKGGSYSLPQSQTETEQIRTTGGWIEVPTKNSRGGFSSKRYTYGLFLEKAITTNGNSSQLAKVDGALQAAATELFRPIVRSALATW